MTATLDEMAKRKPPAEVTAEQQAAVELVRMAKEEGLSLTGPDGLIKLLTKSVIETALGEEMTDHLGYAKHDPAGIGSENIRNGTRSKTVISANAGPVEIDVPRDRAGTFEPQIVKKRQRRLGEVDEIVLSLYAKGLTTGEISAHFSEIYGAPAPSPLGPSPGRFSRARTSVTAVHQPMTIAPLVRAIGAELGTGAGWGGVGMWLTVLPRSGGVILVAGRADTPVDVDFRRCADPRRGSRDLLLPGGWVGLKVGADVTD